MSVFTDLSRSDIESLLSHYDLGHYQAHQGISAGTENTNFFVDTDSGRYVLTLFEKHRPDELPFFMSLGEHLHDDHCAVPQPFRTQAGEFLSFAKGKPAVLFERVSGRHEQPSPQHAATLAEALAEIHHSTEKFDGERPHSHGLAWIQRRAIELAPRFSERDRALLDDAMLCLAAIDRTLPQGVIHADLFHDNVFFEDDRLTGIIDWYFAGIDLYALDIAVCLVDWGLKPDGQPDLDRCVDFAARYHQRRPLGAAEVEALPDLMVQAATRFWLSRELAKAQWQSSADSGKDNITIKDPTPMKALTRYCLDLRPEFGKLLKKQLS